MGVPPGQIVATDQGKEGGQLPHAADPDASQEKNEKNEKNDEVKIGQVIESGHGCFMVCAK